MVMSSRDCEPDSAPGSKVTERIPRESIAGSATLGIVGAGARRDEPSAGGGNTWPERQRATRRGGDDASRQVPREPLLGEQADVETELGRAQVDALLVAREQIDQQRADAAPPQHVGDVAVPRAEAARPAAVREHHQTARAVGNQQIAFQGDAAGVYVDE